MKILDFKITGQVFGLCVGMLAAGSAVAQPFVTSQTYNVNTIIPDNNASGVAFAETFSAPGFTSISSITVSLDITGGLNGDYYAYLTHGSGFAVLLNRVGADTGNPTGYADSGLNITLDDSAANGDVHNYQLTLNPHGAPLTGTWAPDGRTADPGSVTVGSPRTALLSSFDGLDPNGSYTLFIADMNPGGIGTLQNFELTVTGVPEPTTSALLLLGGAGLLLRKRFFKK